MCVVNLIAAVASDGSIGKDSDLLWKIPEDLKFYKAKTLDNVIVMGRATFDSLPAVALKGRHTIVVSKTMKSSNFSDNVEIKNDVIVGIKYAKELAREKKCDVFVAGGGEIYDQLIGVCDFAHITWIDKDFPEANKSFPINKLFNRFNKISESDWVFSDEGELTYKFSTFKNIT